MMSNFPDELTCDMAETYGIFDIKRVPVKLLATLAVGLRDDSRVKRAKSHTPVDDKTMMLAYIIDLLRGVETSDASSMRGHYLSLAKQQEEPKYEVFDGPEAFMNRWKERTGN